MPSASATSVAAGALRLRRGLCSREWTFAERRWAPRATGPTYPERLDRRGVLEGRRPLRGRGSRGHGPRAGWCRAATDHLVVSSDQGGAPGSRGRRLLGESGRQDTCLRLRPLLALRADLVSDSRRLVDRDSRSGPEQLRAAPAEPDLGAVDEPSSGLSSPGCGRATAPGRSSMAAQASVVDFGTISDELADGVARLLGDLGIVCAWRRGRTAKSTKETHWLSG